MIGWVSQAGAASLHVGPGEEFPTIREALAAAPPGAEILVEPGTYTEYLEPVQDVSIVAVGGPEETTLSAPDTGDELALINVVGGWSVTVSGFTVECGGRASVLYAYDAEVSLDDLVVEGAPLLLSRVWISGGTLRLTDVEFGNAAGLVLFAYHLYAYDATVEATDVLFAGGWTQAQGGGAGVTDSTFVCTRCEFAGNIGDAGGALFAQTENVGSDVTLVDSWFHDNLAQSLGKAFHSGRGGAVFVDGGSLTVTGGLFEYNEASTEGGALFATGGADLSITDTTFRSNDAQTGGALQVVAAEQLTVARSTFQANDAAQGSALRLESGGGGGSFDVGGNLFCEQTGESAVFLGGPSAVGAFHHNRVLDERVGGPALWVDGPTVSVAQNTFSHGTQAVRIGAGEVTLLNDVWADQTSLAVETVGGTATNGWNLFWANEVDASGLELDPSTVTADPQFVGEGRGCEQDVHPQAASPLVDGGDPSLLDDDGSRSDIGAYGGPGATVYVDVDGDGVIVGDCRPFDGTVSTPTEEIAADGIDQDCDGLDLCPVDSDGDGVEDSFEPGGIGCTYPAPPSTEPDPGAAPPPAAVVEPGSLPSTWHCGCGVSPMGGGSLSGLALVGWLRVRRRRR